MALMALLAASACTKDDGGTGPARVEAVRFAVEPGGTLLNVGDTATVAAVPYDDRGAVVSGRTIEYASSAPMVVAVSEAGLLTALGVGSATITAKADAATATLAVRVEPAVGAVAVYPRTLTVSPGAAGRLSTVVTDPAGAVTHGATVRYTTSDPGVVAVGADGAVRAVGVGSATLSARSGQKTATVTASVVAAPASGYNIEVRLTAGADPRLHEVARRAADRWSRVIVGDAPDVRVNNLPAGACYPASPTESATIDDLLVIIRTDSVDGPDKALAVGGACLVRSQGSRLPALGVVTVDAADLPTIFARDWGADLLVHELGHAIGIGSREWLGRGLITGHGSTDPRYTGGAAVAASARLGYEGSGTLAVENQGSSAGGHWRETVYGTELMTGFINSAANPLSAVTVGALHDLGYAVSETGADVTTAQQTAPPAARGTGPVAARAPAPAGEIIDRVTEPSYAVDADGRVSPLPRTPMP